MDETATAERPNGHLDEAPPVDTTAVIKFPTGVTETWRLDRVDGDMMIWDDGDTEAAITLGQWNDEYAPQVEELHWPKGAGPTPNPEPPADTAGTADAPDEEPVAPQPEPEADASPPEEGTDAQAAPKDDSGGLAALVGKQASAAAEYRAAEADYNTLAAKAKAAKRRMDLAHEGLMSTVEDLRVAANDCPDLPLFDGPPEAAADGAAATLMADVPGVPGPTAARMSDFGIETVGDFQRHCKKHGDGWHRPIQGVGDGKAQTVIEAFEEWWLKQGV